MSHTVRSYARKKLEMKIFVKNLKFPKITPFLVFVIKICWPGTVKKCNLFSGSCCSELWIVTLNTPLCVVRSISID